MTSLIHLEAIERVRYKELRNKILNHALEWNLNKKCSCIEKMRNVSFENLIVCRHIEKDCLKRFHKKIKKSFDNSLKISKMRLLSNLHYSSKQF